VRTSIAGAALGACVVFELTLGLSALWLPDADESNW
jgi:hypothetical protein